MGDEGEPITGAANSATVATFYKAPPVFSDKTPYARWINELTFWDKMTKIEKKEKGLAVALSLPINSDIRDKVFTEMTVVDLNVEDGLQKLIIFLDKIYKKKEISEDYEAWSKFDKLKRTSGETMEHYLSEYDKCQKQIKKFSIEMPDPVLAFQLLDYSGLSQSEKQIVLTGVDYSKKGKVYEQMVLSIKKFFGDQMIPGNFTSENQAVAVKQEPVMVAKSGFKQQMRSPYTDPKYDHFDEYSDAFYAGNKNYLKSNDVKDYRNQSSDRRQFSQKSRVNPVNGYTGRPYRCHSCRSEYHFLRDCPVKDNKYQPRKTYEVESRRPDVDNE